MSPRSNLRAALESLLGDKYDVDRWIGGGGMAEVFLARRRAHGGLFAVKVLAEHLAGDPKVVARFMAEAQTAAALSGHPNIAPIFDIGEGNGVHYLIMPYIEGEDVSRMLERRGRLSEAEAVCIVQQVAEALVWAAARNVVHRDLKPSNIRIDRTGRVLVLDFGIAKAGDAQNALTTKGETPGTPYYMSPEQIRGERCDPCSDLYSLGVVFFELLTGAKPFEGDSARAIEAGHLNQPAPELHTMAPVDPQIERIVKRLLEKDRERRCPSARELLAELADVAARLPPVHLEPQVDELPAATPGGQASHIEVRKQGAQALPESWIRPRRRPKWFGPALGSGVAALALGFWVITAGEAVTGGKEPPKAEPTTAARKLPRAIADGHGSMLLVEAGPFVFGDDAAESPNKRAQVELPAFYIDATEVSNARYAEFVKGTGRTPASVHGSPNLPVAGVTYRDAEAYCAWAGRRLPSEQEWEKAARGRDGAIYPWGNQPLDSPGRLVPVDEYPERQSPSGALNMAGNVFEWTTSAFPVTAREFDDMRAQTGRMPAREWFCVKGGSFLVENESFFRSYMRRGWPVDQGSPAIGFRCVKDAH